MKNKSFSIESQICTKYMMDIVLYSQSLPGSMSNLNDTAAFILNKISQTHILNSKHFLFFFFFCGHTVDKFQGEPSFQRHQ